MCNAKCLTMRQDIELKYLTQPLGASLLGVKYKRPAWELKTGNGNVGWLGFHVFSKIAGHRCGCM